MNDRPKSRTNGTDKNRHRNNEGGSVAAHTMSPRRNSLNEHGQKPKNEPTARPETEEPSKKQRARTSPPEGKKNRTNESPSPKTNRKSNEPNHTGPHKIKKVVGKINKAPTSGNTRSSAETPKPQHTVATPTANTKKSREAASNSAAKQSESKAPNGSTRKRLSAKGRPPTSGPGTLKHKSNKRRPDPITKAQNKPNGTGNVTRTHQYPETPNDVKTTTGKQIPWHKPKNKAEPNRPETVTPASGRRSNTMRKPKPCNDDKAVPTSRSEATGKDMNDKSEHRP
ncbi:hypothetical protein [Pacificibacter marinus]|uniref:hypothetical protein n=1 Tax=Pacificibacter marinus TaxID=658057 RepID=UPI0008B17380|nr:hypothetical protein [Pacificibacter marinus]SEK54498.1 hypothetical protein SAMN04488032_103251 [Pacificibacter marinus]